MIQFVKFLALSLGLTFAGTESVDSKSQSVEYSLSSHELNIEETKLQSKIDTLKDEKELDLSNVSQIPLQPTNHHGCGHDHALDVMRELDPDYDKNLEHFTNVTLPQLQKRGQKLRENGNRSSVNNIVMPIVFHIIHKPGEAVGTGQNLTDQTIIDQLETLNEDLTASNSGWVNVPPRWESIKGNPQMQFCLAEFDPQGNPSTGIVRHEYNSVPDRDYIRNTIKPQTHWPTRDYYNVWILPIPGTTAFGGVLGWAYFPSAHGANFDGTVQDYRFTGKGGKTLTHEVGHSFGLPHTWGNSGGCGNDDGIADTPLQEANTNSIQRMNCNGSTWPTGPMTCGNEHMYINYMDYSPDACALTFTTGQGDAMRGIAEGTRSSLITSAATVAQSCDVGTPTGGGGDPGGGGPPVTIELDAGIQTIIEPANGEFCSNEQITPRVLLTNDFGDTPLTSCEIRYKISGTPGSVLFNWSGFLEKGEDEVVLLAPFQSPEFSFEFTCWTNNPNGEQDENGFNDEKAISLTTPEVFSPNIFEDFEDESDLPTSTMITVVDPGSTFREWEITDYSAYNVGGTSAYFRNFSDPDGDGQEDILEFPVLDFAEIENPRIAFDVAHYDINNFTEHDTLMIRVSTDCGGTFTTVYKEGGDDLATVSAQQPFEFFPEADEWRNEVVELFEYAGSEKILIEFVNIGYGNNNIYLDNINLSDGCASNVQISKSDLTCPDVCDGAIDLILNGFVVAPQITWSNNVNGQSGEALQDLCPGTYSVTVYDSEFDCEFIEEVEITAPDELTLLLSGNDITIPGADNGSVSAQADGGTSYFTYEWDTNPVETDPFLTGLRPGIYCVTATDQAGCEISDCVEIFGFECELEVEIEIIQPSCDGQPGSGVVTITNAMSPLIIWSQGGPPQTGGFLLGANTNDNLSAGPLYINVSDQGLNDCEETFFFEIFSNEAPTLSEVIVNESGPGNNDGSIDLNVEGDSEYTFEWTTGTSTTEELTGIGEGTYMVTITDINNDCEHVFTYPITNLNCTLEASADITNVTCFEGTDGVISINANGGVSPYNYSWPSGPSFSAQFNLAAGIYPVTVTDDIGCFVIVEAIVEQPALLTTILTTTDESGPGAENGSISSQIFGGTPPYDIEWSTNETDVEMIDGLSEGLYFITITDDNGCSAVKGASVDQLECLEISLTANGAMLSCFEANDGSASVIASGGSEPYNYLWTPGDFDTPNVSNLSAGQYEVRVTGNDGCFAISQVTIDQPVEILIMLDGTNETFLGAMDGSINTMTTGGVGSLNYNWSDGAMFSSSDQSPSSLSPGEYCVTITDETNCSAEACILVEAGSDPCIGFTANSANVELVDQILCNGDQTAIVIANVDGGSAPYTYNWSNGDTEQIASNVGAGSITVTITDNFNCEVIISDFIVDEPAAIEVQPTVMGLSAPGANDGSINIFSTNNTIGTTTCTWTGPNGFTSTSCDEITNLQPGTYTFTLVDANGCEFTEMYVVEGEADPCFGIDISITFDITDESVLGANDGSLQAIVTGANGSIVSYDWTDLQSNTFSGNEIINLAPGTYTVTVTDENDCIGIGMAEVLAGADPCVPLFTIEVTSQSIIACKDDETGQAEVTVEGGTSPFTYEWSNSNATDSSVNDLPAGMMSVTVTDANECFVIASVNITEPEFALDLSVTSINESTPGANNGAASANLSGGDSPYEYAWTGPNGFEANTMTIENLAPGEYCVVATDANLCVKESCVIVQAANDPCANTEIAVELFAETLTCENDGVDVTYQAIGGQEPYTVIWSEEQQTVSSIIVTEPGLVSILVTDANGCIAEGEIMINQNIDLPTYTVELTDPSSAMASDGSAMVEGISIQNFSVIWLDVNNDEIGNGIEIMNLPIGTYSVGVINEDNGCINFTPFVLTADEIDCTSFSIDVAIENITCAGFANGISQIDVSNGTGPFTYLWDPILPDSPIVTDLAPGQYAVTVTDNNGCVDNLMFEITDPEALEISLIVSEISQPGANDGSLMVNIESGVPDFYYTWSNNAETPMISNLSAGEYCVTVSNDFDCIAEACVILEEPSDDCLDFEVELGISNQISCFEANDGVIQVIINNAVEPIIYEWSDNLPGTQEQSDLGAGVYSVTVTDANDCEYISEIELVEPESELVISLTSEGVSEVGASDGTASVVATGGNSQFEYTYTWNDANGQTTSTATGLAAGQYCVTVSSGGCFVVDCIAVLDADDPCVEFSAEITVTNPTCFEECDGTAEFMVEGGLEPYSFTWNDGSTGEFRDDLCQDGVVTITDANDCISIIEYIVTEPVALEIVISSIPVSEIGANDGSASAAAFGGVSPYTYEWDNGMNGTMIGGLEADSYTVVVTDANDCTISASVEVTVMGLDDCNDFTGSFEITPVSCFGGDDGNVEVFTEGGFGTLIYDWDNSNSLGATATGLEAGEFLVVITDQNNCEITLEGTVPQSEEIIITVVDEQDTSGPNQSDGSAIIEVTGGTGEFEITWSNNIGDGLQVDGLEAGEYTVTVEDANGCIEFAVVTINDAGGGNMTDCDDLTASFEITPVSCFLDSDGSIEVIVSGGIEPYEITTNNMDNSLTGLPATTITVTIEDAEGCIFEEAVTIPSPNQLTITAQGFDGNCGLSGSAEAIVSGGTPPFTTIWSNGEIGAFISGLETGEYSATVTDANGCETESSVVNVVKEFNQLDIEVSKTDATCDNEADGRIELSVSPDDPGIEYLWNDGVITADRFELLSGIYTVTITDTLGCEYVLSREILAPDPISASYSVEPGATVSLFNVTINAVGGTAPYTYSWDDGSVGFVNSGLQIGTYACVVTDANGCDQTIEVEIDGSVSTLENLEIITNFSLSPNPTTGSFILDATLSKSTELQVVIYDILGRQVYNNNYRGSVIQERLDLNGQASGTYFIRLYNEEGQSTKKLIKVD